MGITSILISHFVTKFLHPGYWAVANATTLSPGWASSTIADSPASSVDANKVAEVDA